MPEQGNSILSSPDAPHNTGGSDKQGSAGTVQHIRALAMPFSKGSMITEPDGSLLIKDVPMLAEGVWTDSAVGTPLNYISRTLEADAANWIDNSGWNRHIGKVPRASTDKVGEAVNPHFGRFTGGDGREHAAVLSDVRVWPWTQNQRDMQEMIRHNLISFVSVEHTGPEQYNAETHQMESVGLTFTGFAFVNKGACKLCQIPRANEEAGETQPRSQEKKVPMLKKEESLEGLQTRLQKSLDDKFALSPLPGGKYAASTWIVMTFPDRVIYSQDGKKFEIPFMMDNGAIALGTPVEVEEVYVEKKALEMFPGADPKELMAAIQKKQVKQDKTMEPKELEAAITAAVTAATAPIMRELEAVKASQRPIVTEVAKIEMPKELVELPATIKTLSALPETIKALADRIEALEKDGTPKTKVEIRELEDPVNAGILIGVDNGTPVIRRA